MKRVNISSVNEDQPILIPSHVKPLITCICLSLATMVSATEETHLSGAIFTTTPDGSIVNENVRYEGKKYVFLDGGPGPSASPYAAALPAGYYYFQVTDPSGKCLLSSKKEYADANGGTCYESSKKSGQKTSTFMAEPLKCRLFYFDGKGGVELQHSTYTTRTKVKGQWVETVHDCQHQLGSEFTGKYPDELPDGDTIQLFPFANTPNNGGVYKAWVSPKSKVHEACKLYEYDDIGYLTGEEEQCRGFFGFVPRWSKTDNFKVNLEKPAQSFDVALRKFHDKNLNCTLDNYEEYVKNWDYGVTPPMSPYMRKIFTTAEYEKKPTSFSVLGQEYLKWLVDEYMWDAYKYGVYPLNTPFTHFPSFADLRTYTPYHINGYVVKEFDKPFACTPNKYTYEYNVLSGGEVTDYGFVPGDYGSAKTVKYGEYEDPVLSLAFGNFGVAKLKVCKIFANGKETKYASPIKGWKFSLHIPKNVPIPSNINEYENYDTFKRLSQDPNFSPIYNRTVTKYADDYGCATFSVLVPNVVDSKYGYLEKYRVVEHPAYGWDINGYASYTFNVESKLTYDSYKKPIIRGEVVDVKGYKENDYTPYDMPYSYDQTLYFKNNCKIVADFDTKGYWHNKNGLAELTYEDKYYVNSLKPYQYPSKYFEAGDEPFDGKFYNGTYVAAAFSADGYEVWKAGTWQSEISHFLTDANSNADANYHKEQLAQQLLAFIFNTRHRPNAYGLSDYAQINTSGGYYTVAQIRDGAIAAWYGNDSAKIEYYTKLLDGLNNNDYVQIIPGDPKDCPKPYFE
ncbi:hypothetical protein MD588_01005 [Photobacterium sp. SDRW27]|uniref:hypothetical protein n=1 Tax=Photobacterium obscurum TaxID=2829490 RepID=UPI00224488DE|nr:hypothetical protein [Photobacterium obscurum]MCW8327379.1 hypothetical protein [Photobacterium obscurum]